MDIERIRDELNTLLVVNITVDKKGIPAGISVGFITVTHGSLWVKFHTGLFDIRYDVVLQTGKFEHPGVDKILQRAIARRRDELLDDTYA